MKEIPDSIQDIHACIPLSYYVNKTYRILAHTGLQESVTILNDKAGRKMCKWKISLTQMFLHGMQGRLIRFCRPFMPGVEKHTDSLTEIAVKPLCQSGFHRLWLYHMSYIHYPPFPICLWLYPRFYKFSGMYGSCVGQFPWYMHH